MQLDRGLRVNELALLLWNSEQESWHPDAIWPSLLAPACTDDDTLAPEVMEFVRAARESDGEPEARVELPPIVNEFPKIRNYRVTGDLGEGGMGKVYRATWLRTNMEPIEVAVKVAAHGSDTEKFNRRLQAETNLLSRLSHPNIIQVLDSGRTDDGRPFFSAELVEGGLPIDRYCAALNLDIERRLDLFGGLTRVVAYIHSKNIAHRDLKPSNILVAPDGTPKVLDFGLGMLIEPDDEAPSYLNESNTPRRFGTEGFMRQQQARGAPPSPLDDIFALGTILMRMMAGTSDEGSRVYTSIARLVERCHGEGGDQAVISASQLTNEVKRSFHHPVLRVVRRGLASARSHYWVAILASGALSTLFYFGWQDFAHRQMPDQKLSQAMSRVQEQAVEARAFKELMAPLDQGFGSLFERLTLRKGSFRAQVGYAYQLAKANDRGAKAVLSYVLLMCRGSMLEVEERLKNGELREDTKKLRAQRESLGADSGRRRTGFRGERENESGVKTNGIPG